MTRPVKTSVEFGVAVKDVYANETCPLSVVPGSDGVGVMFPGYGDATSATDYGVPVIIEFRNGVPYLIVWADINQDEPTHIISLAGASEQLRQPEPAQEKP